MKRLFQKEVLNRLDQKEKVGEKMCFYCSTSVRILMVAVLLVLTGCGGKPTPTALPAPTATLVSTATPVPTATSTPTVTPIPTPDKSVASLEEVKRAVIRIEGQGSFVDPQFGLQLNVAGQGSGFIIDESGLAVTNNHVVTGAAFLQVWISGESEPRNAKILGVSECSDLAVIDIEGEGYRYLKWYDGEISAGLDVYAAGFPLGDPEFTITRGIVSKERASGETSWASVDAVLEHDATINPGNSGGPLVTKDGQVVGVNYASDPNFNQYFAVARDEALKIIDQLRAGQDVNSIGVNGFAVNDGEGLSGIWVMSVKSGSPADKAGVKGGDIITMLEGLILATDGTMADYCDILRSHDPGDTLGLEVMRFATGKVLEGQLNGRELAAKPFEGIADEIGEETGEVTYHYITVADDSGAITVEIPREWSDFDGSAWLDDEDETIGAALSAASDLDAFYDTYSTPGVFFGASQVLAREHGEASLLDPFLSDYDCTYEGRFEYEDSLYTGLYDYWTDCSDVGSWIIHIAAMPEDRTFIIYVEVLLVTDVDLKALEHIIDSFQVVGTLP